MPLKFEITGDNRNFLESLEESRRGVDRTAREIESSGLSIEDMFKRIGAAAGIAFSLDQAKSFVSKVVEMRSFFQDIESSMKVFLGNEKKAAEFTDRLKSYAYFNMFEFKDLAEASQQMIAYGHDIDTIIPKLDQLSNVAVGTHGSLMDLVALYNRAKSTGVVDSHALQSWAVKGVVVRDVLKEIGEAAGDTSVTFDQLNKVLDHVTGDGGMFHDLQLEMMDNISAEIGQFEDNFNAMLNEIGEKFQGEIVSGIKFGSEIIDNYKEIARYIQDAVVAFGLYKAALIAANVVEKAHVYWKGLSSEATMMNTLATAGETSKVTALTIAKLRLTAATKALTASMVSNPYTLAAVAISALVFGIYKLATAEDQETAARKRANEQMDQFKSNLDDQKNRINSYIQTFHNANATAYEQALAWDNLKKEAPTLTEMYSRQELAALDLGEAQQKVTEAIEDIDYQHAISEVNKWQAAIKKLRDYAESNEASHGGYYRVVEPLKKQFEEVGFDHDTFGGPLVDQMLEFAEEYEKNVRANLEDMKKRIDEINEANKPLVVRIEEANENSRHKQEILNFYDTCMVLAKAVQDATNDQDYSKAVEKFDEYVKTIEDEVEDLKKRSAANPMDMKLDLAYKEKQKLLNEILEMRKGFVSQGYTTIPVFFELNYRKAKQEAEEDEQAEHPGMHKVYDGVSKSGYHWEADEPPVVKSSKEWAKELRQNLKDAEKELKDFDEGKGAYAGRKMTREERKNERQQLLDRIAAIKKEIGTETVKKTNKDKDDKKRLAEAKQKYLELIEEQKEARERAVKDMELATEQAHIDAMEEGTRKTIRQIQLNYKKTAEEINRDYEELKNKKIEDAKALWEANPDNKDKPFDESTVDTTYTKEENDWYISRLEANEKNLKESLRSIRNEQRDYALETLKMFGDTEGKKQALLQETEKIQRDALEERMDFIRQFGSEDQLNKAAALQLDLEVSDDADERQKLEGQIKDIAEQIAGTDSAKVNLLVAIDNKATELTARAVFDSFKQSDDYERFFTRINTLTMSNAVQIKNSIRQHVIQAFKDGALTVDEFKKELEALDEQFERLENSSDNLMTYLKEGLDGLTSKIKETGRELQTIGASISKNGRLDEKDRAFLESFGKIFNTGNGKGNIGSLMSKFGNNWKALGEAVSEAGANMEAGGASFASAIGFFDTLIKNLNSFVQGLNAIVEEIDYGVNEDYKLSNSLWQSTQRAWGHINSSWENFKNGNIFGSITDVIAGAVSWFTADLLDANENITDEVKKSEREVTKLQTAYRVLEKSIDDAYGAAKIGAEQVALENKKMQLEELQRQLALEKSRSSKYQDKDTILSLEDQITQLNIEIEEFSDNIVNNFLGISSAGDAVSTMVDTIVDALRSGEDAISAFGDSVNDMIANMIKNVVASKIIGPMFDDVWNEIEADINNRANNANLLDALVDIYTQGATTIDETIAGIYAAVIATLFEDDKTVAQKIAELEAKLAKETADHSNRMYYKYADPSQGSSIFSENSYFWDWKFNPDNEYFQKQNNYGKYIEVTFEEWRAQQQAYIDQLKDYLEGVSTPTFNDIKTYAEKLRELAPKLEPFIDEIDALIKDLGLMDEEYSQEASSKGFQVMSQDTADELNGRFTALQIAGEKVSESVVAMMATLDALSGLVNGNSLTLSEIRDLIATGNGYLEDVAKYSKNIYNEFGERLEKIETNTNRL